METTTPAPSQNLVTEFHRASIQSGSVKYELNDPSHRKRILGPGWEYAQQGSKFPWPILSYRTCVLKFRWKTLISRRIALKFVNIPDSDNSDLITIHVNGHSTILNPLLASPGSIEFFIPADIQIKGENRIEIQLTDPPEQITSLNRIGLHSIRILQGAAIQSPIEIQSEVRQSVVLAAPITVRFPVDAGIRQTLYFGYGLTPHSYQGEITPRSFELKISLDSPSTDRSISETVIPIHLRRGKQPEWQSGIVQLDMLDASDAVLSFQFYSTNTVYGSVDYLALSDIRLLPAGVKVIADPKAVKDPDILLITMDSLGNNGFSSAGNPLIQMPNMDHILRWSHQFSNAIACSNEPLPSTASMLSGRMPKYHHLYSDQTQPAGIPFLPELLTSRGYHTYSINQIPAKGPFWPAFIRGFEKQFVVPPGNDQEKETARFFQTSLGLQLAGESPVFLWLHIDPGSINPLVLKNASLSGYGKTQLKLSQLNLPQKELNRLKESLGGDEEDIRQLFAREDCRSYEIDRQIGELLRMYHDLRPRRTLLYFIAGTNGRIRDPMDNLFSNDSLSEEVLRVPLIVGQKYNCPDPTGRLIENTISLRALFNIVLIGLEQYSANSWSAPEFSAALKLQPDEYIVSEHGSRRIISLRQPPWKFILSLSEPYFRLASKNLFNLENDADEKRNVISENEAVADELQKAAIKFCAHSDVYPTPEPGEVEEVNTLLKSLNYQ